MTWGEEVWEIILISCVPVGAEVDFWRLKRKPKRKKKIKEKINISFQALLREEIKQNVCRDIKVIYEISFRKEVVVQIRVINLVSSLGDVSV